MITATVIGNVGRDAESRRVGEKTVTSFSLASDRKQRDGQKETIWVSVQVWGRRGESLERYLTRGSRVAVVGSLRQYETRDGRTGLELTADQVELLGRPPQRQRDDRDDRRRDDRDDREQDGPL